MWLLGGGGSRDFEKTHAISNQITNSMKLDGMPPPPKKQTNPTTFNREITALCRINLWWGGGGGMRFRTKIGMQIRRNWMGYVSKKKKKTTKEIIVLCRINWWWWWWWGGGGGGGLNCTLKNGDEFGFIGVLRHIQRYFSIIYGLRSMLICKMRYLVKR